MLTTPYTEHVELVVYATDGTKAVFNQSITNGTPIITGEAWYEKMDYITCDTPSDDCGSYNFRWMGSPNAQFERAASYFQGHFEGLGYDTHLMCVVDTLNPTPTRIPQRDRLERGAQRRLCSGDGRPYGHRTTRRSTRRGTGKARTTTRQAPLPS